MHRDTSLRRNAGKGEWVEVTTAGGKWEMARVTRSERGKPIIKVLPHMPVRVRNMGGNNAEVKIELEGEKKEESKEGRLKRLQALHRNFAHAKGKRMYATLKEYNLLDDYTLKECNDIDCATCSLLNMRKSKIPRTADATKGKLEVGELRMQDLTMMPAAFEGSKFMSVIVDVRSRFISLMALRHKDQALPILSTLWPILISCKGSAIK